MFSSNNHSKWYYPLAIAVVCIGLFGAGFFIGKYQVVCKVCAPESIDFSLFWDAYGKLKDHFIDPQAIRDQDIMYGAISGMTKSLQDPYTEFFNPKQAKMFKQDLTGSFEGIGVEVGIKKEQLTVIAPLKGTPGEKAGLQPGDQIVKIDNTSTLGMPIDQAVSMIRGKGGTSVTLTIYREGWKDVKEIAIIRDTIKVDSMDWEMKNGSIAYIAIHQFSQSLPSDFKKAAFEILSSGAKKIILDLRNNPGGYLEVSQDIAGWFLENDSTVVLEDFGKDRPQQSYNADGNEAFLSYPIVVLINKGSASAAEILAGALRDNRGVKLIGEKSFGKGSVQEVVELRDGSSFLKVTVAKWLTPKGDFISEVGLVPDIKISAGDEDGLEKNDPQLDKALEIIMEME